MKILDVNNMLDAASDSDMPELEVHRVALEQAATALAQALAKHLHIAVGEDAVYEQGFGGLCAAFKPAYDGQDCPPEIDDGDPGGDWWLGCDDREEEKG